MEEIWKDIPKMNAQASSLGRIKSFYSGKILSLQKGLKGKYLRVQLSTNKHTYSVHRLVAMAWHPNPNNLPIVNHLDHDGLNNKPDNLEWNTQSNNIAHSRRGKNTPIDPVIKMIMIECYHKGFSKLAISNYFKITDTSVRRVINSI